MLPLRPQRPDALTPYGDAKTALTASGDAGAAWRFQKNAELQERGALPRGNAFFERFGQLFVNELECKAFFQVSYHPRLYLAEHDHRFQRRPVFRGDGGAGQRHVDDPAGHLGAVLKREHGDRVARHDTIVAAVFRQIENVAVGEPGQLCGELVALARSGPDGHGETVVDNSGNPALDPANIVWISDHAVADITDAW